MLITTEFNLQGKTKCNTCLEEVHNLNVAREENDSIAFAPFGNVRCQKCHDQSTGKKACFKCGKRTKFEELDMFNEYCKPCYLDENEMQDEGDFYE